MTGGTLFGLCGAIVVGLGLYGVLVQPHPLRKILAFNLLASGMFILFGVVARRGAAAGFAGDPVPHGLLITAIVVSFAATALAIALLVQLVAAGGTASLRPDAGTKPETGPPET